MIGEKSFEQTLLWIINNSYSSLVSTKEGLQALVDILQGEEDDANRQFRKSLRTSAIQRNRRNEKINRERTKKMDRFSDVLTSQQQSGLIALLKDESISGIVSARKKIEREERLNKEIHLHTNKKAKDIKQLLSKVKEFQKLMSFFSEIPSVLDFLTYKSINLSEIDTQDYRELYNEYKDWKMNQ